MKKCKDCIYLCENNLCECLSGELDKEPKYIRMISVELKCDSEEKIRLEPNIIVNSEFGCLLFESNI